MKIAIVGSRDYQHLERVHQYIRDCLVHEDVIISGGAKGVDTYAAEYGRYVLLDVVVFYPEWSKYGKAAGMIRNQAIVDAADKVVAFWNGKSKGTADTIAKARKAGKPVEIIKDEKQS